MARLATLRQGENHELRAAGAHSDRIHTTQAHTPSRARAKPAFPCPLSSVDLAQHEHTTHTQTHACTLSLHAPVVAFPRGVSTLVLSCLYLGVLVLPTHAFHRCAPSLGTWQHMHAAPAASPSGFTSLCRRALVAVGAQLGVRPPCQPAAAALRQRALAAAAVAPAAARAGGARGRSGASRAAG